MLKISVKPFGSSFWWFKPKFRNFSQGVEYEKHVHTFPDYFKQFLKAKQNEEMVIKKLENKIKMHNDETNFSKTDEDIINHQR